MYGYKRARALAACMICSEIRSVDLWFIVHDLVEGLGPALSSLPVCADPAIAISATSSDVQIECSFRFLAHSLQVAGSYVSLNPRVPACKTVLDQAL